MDESPKNLLLSRIPIKILGPLLILIGLLPLLIYATRLRQLLFPRAASTLSTPAKVLINPGAIELPAGATQPVYLSAQAVDTYGTSINSGVTYMWGISSTSTIGDLKPDANLPIAAFIPARNVSATGDLWVRAFNDNGSALGSIRLCVGILCPTVTHDPNNFTDVDKNSWSWKYILQIVPLGLIPPRTSTTFEPAGTISRTEMAQFLHNTYRHLKGTDAPIVPTPFTDISNLPQNQQDTIARVYGLGLTAGTSTTTFSPTMLVDRAQTAVFLVKLYKLITNIDPPLVETPFTDLTDPDIAYSQNWVPKLYGLKITAGISPALYGPKLQVTREQMTAFLSNILRAISAFYPPSSTTPAPTTTPTPQVCAQVLTPARNEVTQECRIFNNSCLSNGWVPDNSCLTPKPSPSPDVTQTTQTFSQLANQLVNPPPSTPPASPDSLPPITIPPEASPAQANIFIQIINLVQNFFRQILGLP